MLVVVLLRAEVAFLVDAVSLRFEEKNLECGRVGFNGFKHLHDLLLGLDVLGLQPIILLNRFNILSKPFSRFLKHFLFIFL